MHDRKRVALAVLSLGIALAGEPVAASASNPVALLGHWQLNEKDSEDPKVKFAGPRATPGPEVGRPVGTNRRWPPDPGVSDRARASPEPRTLSGPREFLDPPKTLTITGTADELTVEESFSDGRTASVPLLPDGREQKLERASRVARWQGSSLVVDYVMESGSLLTNRYNVMADPRQLEVYSRLAVPGKSVLTLRRVYVATAAEQQ